MKKPKNLIGIYVIIAILTFGHSWVFSPINQASKEMQSIDSFLSAIFWPLYWSVKFFQLYELK